MTYVSQGPEAFLAQLDSEQDAPEVIWNVEMRNRLLGHLTTELESYVKFRATDPLALYIHVPKAPLAYPELEGGLSCHIQQRICVTSMAYIFSVFT